eukprot:14419847-Alexandrium_andersonii.AAC.1
MADPRDPAEAGLVAALRVRPLPVGATRSGQGPRAALDLVAAPRGEAWRWGITSSAAGSLSDHA